MFKLTLTLIIYICLLLPSAVAFAATADFKKCVGALKAFEVSINNGESSVDANWVRGTRGWLLVNYQMPQNTIDELKNYVGNKRDITVCSTVGVSTEEVELFILAYHGYLSEEPFEDLAECIAAMTVTIPEMDKILGALRSQSFGEFLGKRVGTTLTQLNYLYSSKKSSLGEIQIRATRISSSLPDMPLDKRADFVTSYISKCTLYSIPLKAMLEGSDIQIE